MSDGIERGAEFAIVIAEEELRLSGAETSSSKRRSNSSRAVAMVQATEKRYSMHGGAGRGLRWREPFLTSRRLQA
jgi:hypothetical protein